MEQLRFDAATKAMQALIAQADSNTGYRRMTIQEILATKKGQAEIVARDAVIFADALVAELKKEE